MSAKRDKDIALRGTVKADRAQVIAACGSAVGVLGKHARHVATSDTVTVEMLPGMSASMSKVSPTVRISVRDDTAGGSRVEAGITHYLVRQSTYMFIPIGPKRLVGKSFYVNLLRALQQELRALDPSASVEIGTA